ncbi:MAG TPA: threonine synthase [Dehalococcoidia bacterium]|nr:threonine synthase [Dehalococcoidia bacterium]
MTRILERYRDFLPITPATPLITIGEGDTPLVRSRKLEKELCCGELYFKLEGCNPTGSFKDRGMVVAVARAMETGSKAIACASTGNTSASAAAYGAHCGLKVFVLVPRENIALGKLAQALVFGARVIGMDGNFDQCLQIVRTLTQRHPITLVNSINPHRIEGQKTAAFEIADALGQAPDYLFLPVGNAGNITAYWRGFVQYREAGRTRNLPRMMGFEAEGAAAIVLNKVIEKPETIATAIRIGNPASWQGAVAARDESGGIIDCVSDDEILKAYHMLAAKEGIFGEPASAASLAGLIKSVRNGLSLTNRKVVCVITGNGLKDTDTALKQAPSLTEVPADLAAVEQVVL